MLDELLKAQREHHARLKALAERVAAMDVRLDGLDAELRRGFATVLTAVQAIADRLD
jgi:hypothetical protein